MIYITNTMHKMTYYKHSYYYKQTLTKHEKIDQVCNYFTSEVAGKSQGQSTVKALNLYATHLEENTSIETIHIL